MDLFGHYMSDRIHQDNCFEGGPAVDFSRPLRPIVPNGGHKEEDKEKLQEIKRGHKSRPLLFYVISIYSTTT